jgi:U3 small nucleolar RNA-associated protein 5
LLLVGTITALDRANAEDAILPLPKLHTQEKKRKHGVTKPSGDKLVSDSDLGTTAILTEKRGKLSLAVSSPFLQVMKCS